MIIIIVKYLKDNDLLSDLKSAYRANQFDYRANQSAYRANQSAYRANQSAYRANQSAYRANQSAYRANHSTEMAVPKVLADLLLALDSCDLVMRTLLDLSVAFDNVDHDTFV